MRRACELRRTDGSAETESRWCSRGSDVMRGRLAPILASGLAVLSVVGAVAVAVPSAGAVGGSTGSTGAPAACTRATASQLVEQHRLNGFLLPNPVRQVLCGSFTGPGSEAMAVTIGAPTCWPIQRWAVFTLSGGTWRLVLDQPAYLIPPLRAVGSAIRETTAVHRSNDPRCLPSGGTRSRLWRWNGSRLAAGPWKQVTGGKQPDSRAFDSPSRNISCGMFDDSSRQACRLSERGPSAEGDPRRERCGGDLPQPGLSEHVQPRRSRREQVSGPRVRQADHRRPLPLPLPRDRGQVHGDADRQGLPDQPRRNPANRLATFRTEAMCV